MLLAKREDCVSNPLHEAEGACEVCRKPFCMQHSINLDLLSDEVRAKLILLTLGSLPHIICTGCRELMTMLYGEGFEKMPQRVDLEEVLRPIWKVLDQRILRPERSDDRRDVLAVVSNMKHLAPSASTQ